ncbi:MAG TPA: DeoR family transcriptional regulator [Candidatus Dojkabacteria bacterium]|nr:DeoR family transcriptional regulator [Candidatus Dojkabacteria bacterium]HQG57916.1 DeoR family transcriptional regulator [Candidatus Dojkabacteria bacterium]
MNLPTFTITNLILDYIIRIELSANKIKGLPLPYNVKNDIYQLQKTDDIYFLGELTGYKIGLNKALLIQKGKELPSDKTKLKLFINYRSINEFVKTYNQMQFIKPSADLLIHINRLAMSGIVDEWETGKFRTFSEKPNDIYDNWYKYRDYYPQLDVSSFLNDLCDWTVDPKIKIHKLIRLAILNYEMIDKSPFFVGNQVTTVIFTGLLLKEFGYNIDNLQVISKIYNNLGENLLEAFKISKSKKDQTAFIEALLYSILLETISLETNISSNYESKVKNHAQLSLDLNNRQIKAIEYLNIHKKISRQEYSKLMGISFMTAFRDLQDLLEKGYLSTKGSGRGTIYLYLDKSEDIINNESKKDIPVFVDDTLRQ